MYVITQTTLPFADPNNTYGWDDSFTSAQKAVLLNWTINQITRRFLTTGTITVKNDVTNTQYVIRLSDLIYDASSQTLNNYIVANASSFMWTTIPPAVPTPPELYLPWIDLSWVQRSLPLNTNALELTSGTVPYNTTNSNRPDLLVALPNYQSPDKRFISIVNGYAHLSLNTTLGLKVIGAGRTLSRTGDAPLVGFIDTHALGGVDQIGFADRTLYKDNTTVYVRLGQALVGDPLVFVGGVLIPTKAAKPHVFRAQIINRELGIIAFECHQQWVKTMYPRWFSELGLNDVGLPSSVYDTDLLYSIDFLERLLKQPQSFIAIPKLPCTLAIRKSTPFQSAYPQRTFTTTTDTRRLVPCVDAQGRYGHPHLQGNLMNWPKQTQYKPFVQSIVDPSEVSAQGSLVKQELQWFAQYISYTLS